MELSERFIAELEREGFTTVYEWQDKPDKIYEEHSHDAKVSFYVTDGSITFDFSGVKKVLKAGERLDIPPNTRHSAVVGKEGVIYIIGEE